MADCRILIAYLSAILLFCMCEPGNTSGSCIDAGFTECCSNGCTGVPGGICFCDPSCLDYGDCCSDIYQLCNPEIERAYNTYRPVVVFTERVTFHTASLAWIINPHSTINAAYRVSLDKMSSSSSNSEPSNTSYYTVPIGTIFSSGDSMTFKFQFVDLLENTSYQYGISIVGDNKTISNAAQGYFQTLAYPLISNVTLNQIEATSVNISWEPIVLPDEVSLVQYQVFHNKRGHGQVGVVSTEETSLTVRGLGVHDNHAFRVSALFREADGNVHELAKSDALEVYLSDFGILQLVATAPIECGDWHVGLEVEMLADLHSALLGEFRERCSEHFPSHNIKHDMITPLCLNGMETSVLVTYRTQLVTMETCSIQELFEAIEHWLSSSHDLELRDAAGNGVNLSFTTHNSCPARIEDLSSPLCVPVSGNDVAMETGPDCSCPVSNVMLIIYLILELVLLTFLYLVLGVVAVYISRRMLLSHTPGKSLHKTNNNGDFKQHKVLVNDVTVQAQHLDVAEKSGEHLEGIL